LCMGIGGAQLQQLGRWASTKSNWGQGKRADQFLTVIYQLHSTAADCSVSGRRLTQATLREACRPCDRMVVKGSALCV